MRKTRSQPISKRPTAKPTWGFSCSSGSFASSDGNGAPRAQPTAFEGDGASHRDHSFRLGWSPSIAINSSRSQYSFQLGWSPSSTINSFRWDGAPRSQSQLATGMEPLDRNQQLSTGIEPLDRNPAFEWDEAPQGLMATLAIPKQNWHC